jgi:hypothetical protein
MSSTLLDPGGGGGGRDHRPGGGGGRGAAGEGRLPRPRLARERLASGRSSNCIFSPSNFVYSRSEIKKFPSLFFYAVSAWTRELIPIPHYHYKKIADKVGCAERLRVNPGEKTPYRVHERFLTLPGVKKENAHPGVYPRVFG